MTGSFSSLIQPVNPNVTAIYYDQGTSDSADDTVSVDYEPVEGASSQAEGSRVALQAANRVFNMTGQRQSWGYMGDLLADAERSPRLFADAGIVMSDAGYGGSSSGNGFYLTPYMATIEKDAAPVGYDVDIQGVVAGYDRKSGDKQFGVFMGYSQNELDYTGSWTAADSEEQDLYVLGASASLKIAKAKVSAELGYDGEYGDETTAHNVWVQFYYNF